MNNWTSRTDDDGGSGDDDGDTLTRGSNRGNSSRWRSLAICGPYPSFARKVVLLDSGQMEKANVSKFIIRASVTKIKYKSR